jgi:hypothetical protein
MAAESPRREPKLVFAALEPKTGVGDGGDRAPTQELLEV